MFKLGKLPLSTLTTKHLLALPAVDLTEDLSQALLHYGARKTGSSTLASTIDFLG